MSGFFKKTFVGWLIERRKEISKHKKVADFWAPIIKKYENGDIEKYSFEPKVKFNSNKIIWQYWGQGFDDKDIPEVVKICADSVDKYCGDYIVVRLDDDNIDEYLDLPEFVKEKRKNPKFKRVFFSDLLRLALLSTYGGIWLDATILLTGAIPSVYEKYDYFMYQRSNDVKHKFFWSKSCVFYWGWGKNYKVKMLTSIMCAKKGCKEIGVLQNIILYFWRTEDDIPDYFFLQILFNELVEKGVIKNCEIVSDCTPHYIQAKILDNYKWLSEKEILEVSPIHKLSYFDSKGVEKLKDIIGLQ